MSILIPGTEQGVYQEPETPMTYNQGLDAWEETSGYTFDADAQAWEERWGSKKILFANGDAAGMGGYTISHDFKYNTGCWGGANGITTCTIVDGLLKMYVHRAVNVDSSGFHVISNDYLPLNKYSNVYIQVDTGYLGWDGNFELAIKTDQYLNYYSSDNLSPNIPILIFKNESNEQLDISGLYRLPITNTDKAKLVISIYTNAGSYDYDKVLTANISKIWME